MTVMTPDLIKEDIGNMTITQTVRRCGRQPMPVPEGIDWTRTDTAIAAGCNVSKRLVCRWRKSLQIPSHSRGGRRGCKPIPEDIDWTMPNKAIGENYGVSETLVWRWRRKLGIPPTRIRKAYFRMRPAPEVGIEKMLARYPEIKVYVEAITRADIAQKYGISEAKVSYLCRQYRRMVAAQ